jgi:hypothetical protein
MVNSQMLETVKMSALSWQEDGRLRLNCPDCDSATGQWRGYRETKNGVSVHRRRCTRCGRWFQEDLTLYDTNRGVTDDLS